MTVYYNEFDKNAAEWLENLIADGHIAPGVVDTRSIEDVRPTDLRDFKQCHFFAGLGVWSYSLRAAGWRDDRSVWTGSCPCQPYSQAGEGLGFADERHLWPAMFHLLSEHVKWLRQQKRPLPAVLGEQVASKDADPWIDLVQADMETLGYSFGAVAFPSASVGAPHIRDRNYWAANANDSGRQRGRAGQAGDGRASARLQLERLRDVDGLGDASSQGLDERERERGIFGGAPGAVKGEAAVGAGIHIGGLGHAQGERRGEAREAGRGPAQRAANAGATYDMDSGAWAGPTNGLWADADWLGCTDGKWRPVEPGTFPLVDGLATGMGALSAEQRRLAEMAGLDAASLKRAKAYRPGGLRGYGNAINAEAARVWIECVMEAL